MTTKITPFLESKFEATETESGSQKFRKQVLPVGKYNYKGRELNFDKDNLSKMAESFNKKAYDQVPFQLATDRNEHNDDPERTRGEIESMEVADDGLYANFSMDEEGAKLVRKNPKLGVSASIKEGRERADGGYYPVAIKHVLGTLDPKVTGMSPWSQVQLSEEEGGNVLNFSAITYSDMEEQKMPEVKDGLSEDEVGKLRQLLQNQDQTLDDMLATIRDTDDGSSDDASEAKKLAQESSQQVTELSTQLARTEFEREADQLVRDGVPKSMIELARPVMSSPDGEATVDLAEGGKSDAKDVVRGILKEAKGTVNLSDEQGHGSAVGSGTTDPDYDNIKNAFFANMQ